MASKQSKIASAVNPSLLEISKKESPTQTGTSLKHHNKFRKFLAWLCGIIAVNLILLSVFVLWAQDLFTNTTSYVSTVAPLSQKPKTRDLLVNKTTDILLNNAPVKEISQKLLPATAQQLPEQRQKEMLHPILEQNVRQIVSSDDFSQLWLSANQQAHSQLVAQLEGSSSTGTIDLSSLVSGVVGLLKPTQLGFIVNDLKIPADAGKLQLPKEQLQSLQRSYGLAKKGIMAMVALTALFIVTTITLAVDRWRALRHMAVVTTFSAGLVALLLSFPVRLSFGDSNNQVVVDGYTEISRILLSGLQRYYLITAALTALVAIGVYIWQRFMASKRVVKNPSLSKPEIV